MKFIVLFLLHSAISYAKVQVVNHQNQRVQLKGISCANLIKNQLALKQWNFDEKKFSSLNRCQCDKGICKLDITDVLPKHILYLEGKTANYSGPNCFNTALNDQKIIQERRVSTEHEANFWTSSPLCNKIKTGEKVLPGDLRIIYDDSGLALHAFTYISDDLVFSKGGPSKEAKYKLDSYEWMFRTYKVRKECYHVNKPGQCPRYGMAFSCQSFQSYRNKNPMKNKKIQEVLNQLDGIAMTVELLLLSDSSADLIKPKALNQKLQSFRLPLIEQKDNPNHSEQEKFYWKIIWFKFLGLDRQLQGMI